MAVVGLHSFFHEHSVVMLLMYYSCGFAIPFFFMCSGFFLLNRGVICWDYPLKKLFGIIRIVILWNLIYDILRVLINILSTGKLYVDFFNIPKNVIRSLLQKGQMSHLWYLGALVVIYLLLPWISQMTIERKKCLFIILVGVCFIFQTISLGATYPLQSYVLQTFRIWTWLFYFFIGGYIEKITFIIKNKINFSLHLVLTILVLILVISIQYFIGTKVILFEGRPLKAEYFYDSILDVVWVVTSFSFILRMQLHPHMEMLVTKVANLTLGIYIIHMPVRLMVVRVIKVVSVGDAISFWLIVFGVALGLAWGISKTKIGRYLIKI